MGPAALGSQNWRMHPEPRQQSWHSRGEKSFLPGACPCKKQIGFYSGPCEGRKSATLGSSLPKAFPLGEASGSCNPTQKKRPKSGHIHGLRNRRNIASLRPTTPKPASGNERAIKPGVQGACPRPSFSPFLGRNGDPAGQAGPPGRCAPRHRKSPDHSQGTQYLTAPPPGTGREPTSQVWTCGGPKPDPLPAAGPLTPRRSAHSPPPSE